MSWAAIGLGANVGNRHANLRSAVAGLAALGRVIAVSPIFETAPIGGPRQDKFFNAVAVIDTDLTPRALLDGLLGIERAMGRVREERWGPRTIDLDLLVFETVEIDEPGLTVPHPHLTERRFVLYPLLTVWPRPELPDGTKLADAAVAVGDQELEQVTGGFDLETGDWRGR